jgi:hypothetical protein
MVTEAAHGTLQNVQRKATSNLAVQERFHWSNAAVHRTNRATATVITRQGTQSRSRCLACALPDAVGVAGIARSSQSITAQYEVALRCC